MSEYCDIFPEDPTCAVAEEEEVVIDETPVDEEGSGDVEGDDEEVDAEEGDAEEGMDEMKEEMEEEMMEKMDKMDWDMTPSQMWMKAGDLMRFASIDPFMGEITYLMVAIGVTTSTALDLFRYNKDINGVKYYDAFITGSKADSTNFFKIGDLIMKYTTLAVFGVAAITQILAGLGIAPGINIMVWWFGVMLAGGLASFIGGMFKFIAYETGYSNIATLNNAAAMASIKQSMVEDVAMETSIGLTLFMEGENWMWAQWENLTSEEQMDKLDELMAEIEEWDAEKMAEMESEMGDKKKEKKSKKEEADEEAADEEAADEEAADEEAADEEAAVEEE